MKHLIFCLTICLSTPAWAESESYCSRGARMDIDGDHMKITEDGKTESFEHGGSVGTGLNGQVWKYEGRDESQVLYDTTIVMDVNLNPPDEPKIYLFRDRVYWPCER